MNNENGILLPDLSEPYSLSKEQIHYYQEKGHIFLKGLASPNEAAAYREPVREWVRKLNPHTKSLEERDTYGKAFIQIGNLWRHSKEVERFVLARRFAKIAADLMGVDGVRLYHDQALFKEPGGGHTPWHQDQIYWPFDTKYTVTLWMPLVPISEEVGTMTFASGTQKEGFISRQSISDESHKTLQQYITTKGFEQVQYGAMAPGDATFHSGWTAHCAPGNPTATMREVMTIIYIADGVHLVEPDSAARKGDFDAFFPGLKPGDLAANELTPLIYKRQSNNSFGKSRS